MSVITATPSGAVAVMKAKKIGMIAKYAKAMPQ